MPLRPYLLLVILIIFLNPSKSCLTWKIEKSTGQGIPNDAMKNIITLLNNGLKAPTPHFSLSLENFGIYIRYLLEDVFTKSRYNEGNKNYHLFMSQSETAIGGFLKSIGNTVGNSLSNLIKLPLVREDVYQEATFLFTLPISTLDELGVFTKFADLMGDNFNYDNISETKLGTKWAVNGYEMVHFVFQLGYHNAGLPFDYIPTKNQPNSMDHTVEIAKKIYQECLNRHRNKIQAGLVMFGTVLKYAFESESQEFFDILNIETYEGENDSKKLANMYGMLENFLFYYVGNEEKISYLETWYTNPALEQFLIKGSLMVSIGLAKNLIVPGIDLGLELGSEVLEDTINGLADNAVSSSIDSAIDAINIPQLVATKNQKDLGLVDTNVISNLVQATSERKINKYYVIIDKTFTMLSQAEGNEPMVRRTRARTSRRVLI